ncbi:pentatricopeptide repeat-containing protein At2g33760-like [Aristolochia californica]|uniref:pentatricopeptide repeat-containing protein At2g33760-like n=1 Tax=Aristolochia californica TaxID=171875 RepID=UPI0035D7CDF6
MHGSVHIIHKNAILIESCKSNRDLRTLRSLHARVLALGIAHHDFLRVKLVSSYAHCSQLPDALHIFHCARRRPTFLFNSLIKAFDSLNLHSQSINFYLYMLQSGKLPDRHTFPSLLKSCASLSALHLGRLVHAAAVVHGFSSDIANSNALIAMYAKSGDVVTARRVFDEMPERNVVSWSAIIGAYGAHGMCQEALGLFEDMLESGVLPDSKTFTSVLAACSHGGMVETGRKVFETMEERFGVRPRLEHYTCMVDLLGKAGAQEEAKALIERIDSPPDRALWRAFLGACRLHGSNLNPSDPSLGSTC